jgi:hypothetical protein
LRFVPARRCTEWSPQRAGAAMRLAAALRLALLAAAALAAPRSAHGAVHPYAGSRFAPLGDAFVFRGGREGLFRSRSEARSVAP